MKVFNLLMLILMTTGLAAQSLDEELGFIYVKADYLLETNRYDEAISEFTKIIAKDASFRDALYKRAEAKFNVGAFQGTKNDLLDLFDIKGISPEAVLLYGKTQKNLGNTEASETTMETARILFPNGTSPRDKASNKEASDDDDSGLKQIEEKITSILDDLLPKNNEDKEPETGSDDSRSTPSSTNDRSPSTRTPDTSNTDTRPGNRKEATEPEPEPEPEVDDSVREIYIDEDVTLEVKNGLGARNMLEQPSILVISTTSGDVVIDICVNENGKVTEAEFNAGESTLKTESIISLAVRKSKEFWFKKSSQQEMCGTIVFKITGS